ncbi:hypothetical protein BSLA_02f0141 [Burkholderia stabilis]|nr:hypothetical protein BSLA_02f0141 [Burkholderia stabilis]
MARLVAGVSHNRFADLVLSKPETSLESGAEYIEPFGPVGRHAGITELAANTPAVPCFGKGAVLTAAQARMGERDTFLLEHGGDSLVDVAQRLDEMPAV